MSLKGRYVLCSMIGEFHVNYTQIDPDSRYSLYMQPTSDDASHDETLSSRVAALNMLDLGLEHLDIHVDNAGPELDLVVAACGESKHFNST
jgi:hypothetical protein